MKSLFYFVFVIGLNVLGSRSYASGPCDGMSSGRSVYGEIKTEFVVVCDTVVNGAVLLKHEKAPMKAVSNANLCFAGYDVGDWSVVYVQGYVDENRYRSKFDYYAIPPTAQDSVASTGIAKIAEALKRGSLSLNAGIRGEEHCSDSSFIEDFLSLGQASRHCHFDNVGNKIVKYDFKKNQLYISAKPSGFFRSPYYSAILNCHAP